MKRYCLFHKDPDGFFSAYFIHRLHPDAEFIPINYNDPEPVLEDGAEVWIVDFSWVGPKERVTERLEALCARMKHVNVIDHHEGAEPALRAVTARNFTLRYDITKAGTELCFDLWANLEAAARKTAVPKIPYAAELVGDYDMWRHQKDGYKPSKKIDVERMNAAVWLMPEKWGSPEFFKCIEAICYSLVGWDDCDTTGRVALQVAARHIERAMERVVWIGLRSPALASLYIVPAINSAEYPNELADALADRFPGVPFVAIFHLGKHGWKFSLRGRGGSVAVNEVAALYGGNGHKNAAGFTVRDLSGIPFKEAI